MATKKTLEPLSEQELKDAQVLPATKVVETTFPRKAAANAAEARAAFKRWADKQPDPEPPKNPQVTVVAVEPTAAAMGRLASVAESETAIAEMIAQDLDEEAFLGTVFSAITTYEYMKMEAEYRQKIASASARDEAQRQWPAIVASFQKAYAATGLRDVTEAQLSRFAKQLAADRRNLDTVAGIVNSGQAEGSEPRPPAQVRAAFVAQSARIIDRPEIVIPIPSICAGPLVQGTFTKHFSRSFELKVKISYPCPSWSNPFKWCTKTFTIASVSFSVGVNVGYKVTCCGASVWGQASVQACASVLGFKKCAGCTATVVGVAGVSRTPVSGGKCNYGLGATASLVCKVGGATVLNLSVAFGYTIVGPCPPAKLPC